MDDCISMVGDDDGSGNGGVNDTIILESIETYIPYFTVRGGYKK